MSIIRIILTVLLVIDCIALSVIVLLQEGKQAGLGSLGGGMGSDSTYWSKNKGRSLEGRLIKITTVLAVLFFVLAALLNIPSI